MDEPCVYEPYLIDDGEVVDECDNCQCDLGDHCGNVDCHVCPGEFHICVELEGKLME